VLEQDGVRRTVYDIIILALHLVLSNFTLEGVDVDMASRIVHWTWKQYPEGMRCFTYVSMINVCKEQLYPNLG
jgi:hypothetical protein